MNTVVSFRKNLIKITAFLILSACIAVSPFCVYTSADTEPESYFGEKVSHITGTAGGKALDYESEAAMLADMQQCCENDNFALYFSQYNMAVALVNKSTGAIFTTNPYNAALDSGYGGTVAERLDSQIIITYLENGNSLATFSSSDECVKLGQYSADCYENGICFYLSLGEEKAEAIIPVAISTDRYKQLVKKLNDDDIDTLSMYYEFSAAEDAKSNGISERFPGFSAQDVYYCSVELNEREEKKLSKIFAASGYSRDDYYSDLTKLGIEEKTESYPNFKLELCYLLTDYGVEVSVPNSSISFNSDFPLLNISVLPLFGAQASNPDSDGYLFIPDGSGAIINFDDTIANRRKVISGRIYGDDGTVISENRSKEDKKQFSLPVFGIAAQNNSSLFGIISSGDSMCDVFAYLGKPNGNYYSVNTVFGYTSYEAYVKETKVANNWSRQNIYLYDDNHTKEDFTVKYFFLSGDNAGYSGMASVYRNYLIENGMSETKKTQNEIHIQTVGSALVEKTFFGFEYKSETAFTRYLDNIEILKELSENGIKSPVLTLDGWSKNGLDAGVSNKTRFSRTLGGRGDFKKLAKYCNENNVKLETKNEVAFVSFVRAFDGFSKSSDATKSLDLKYSSYGKLVPDTMAYGENGYVTSSSAYGKYIIGLLKNYGSTGTDALNLGMLGSSLNSNFNKKGKINRSETKKNIISALSIAENNKCSFLGGNSYVLPFADAINDIPCENSGYVGETAYVPFLQLSASGCVECRSDAVNLSDNTQRKLLQCLQSGTVPTFILTYKNTEKLKLTEYTEYFATDYEILKSSIADSYSYLKNALTAINDSRLIKHLILDNDVFLAQFENGTEIVVNLSGSPYIYNSVTINPENYAVL